MKMPLDHYRDLACLFEYPESDYPARVQGLCDLLESRCPSAAAELNAFAKALPSHERSFSAHELYEMQEIFTRSFDVQSITTLSVGYIVFGDDYKRGELLVNLSREQREAGVDCGSELPDHLPNVLRLIATWRDREMVAEFVEEILHPALERMVNEFDSARMEQRSRLYRKHFKTLIASSEERGTIFRMPLAALLAVVRDDFDLSGRKRSERDSAFLGSIGRELDIETSEGRPAQARSLP
jgi:nitrate reductase assembly molybdenum cofactor insertion protein NarJ